MNMMINNSFVPPEAYTQVSDYFRVMAKPGVADQLLAQWGVAAEAYSAAKASWEAERATFAAAQAEHNAALERATSEQTAKLSAAQTAFDTLCASRKQSLDDRDAALAQLEIKARSDSDAAAVLRADLERRLAQIRVATS